MTILLAAQTALATCYGGGNEGAFGAEPPGSMRRGIKGEMDHYSAQPNGSSTTIVHPTQIVYNSNNFVGWGTAKGDGVDNCASYFGTRWQIYFDGRNAGDYFCEQHYGDVSDTAQNQFFRIEWTTCPGDGNLKFVVYWNSAWKSCKIIGASSGRPSAGSESIGTTSTQDLQIGYAAIRAKPITAGWQYFSSLSTCETDYPYVVDNIGVSSWTVNVSP
ncbi:MAG: hypothetical protein ACR2K4_05250 [Candidatus Limnocylindria bacterium]